MPTRFYKNWNVYNKMIAHNYMFHREFINEINRVIDTMPVSQPLTVLDLGCGDAALFSKVLERRPIALYVGYDTSAEVLRYAAASLQGLKADTRLVNDYLQNATTIEQEPFDLVYSSFAIHHLQEEQKIRFSGKPTTACWHPAAFLFMWMYCGPTASREANTSRHTSIIWPPNGSPWTSLNSN